MRTTVSIDDHLLEAARQRARRDGVTLGELVEEALRRELSRESVPRSGPPVPVYDGQSGLRAGIDARSNRALREALDEGRALEQLR